MDFHPFKLRFKRLGLRRVPAQARARKPRLKVVLLVELRRLQRGVLRRRQSRFLLDFLLAKLEQFQPRAPQTFRLRHPLGIRDFSAVKSLLKFGDFLFGSGVSFPRHLQRLRRRLRRPHLFRALGKDFLRRRNRRGVAFRGKSVQFLYVGRRLLPFFKLFNLGAVVIDFRLLFFRVDFVHRPAIGSAQLAVGFPVLFLFCFQFGNLVGHLRSALFIVLGRYAPLLHGVDFRVYAVAVFFRLFDVGFVPRLFLRMQMRHEQRERRNRRHRDSERIGLQRYIQRVACGFRPRNRCGNRFKKRRHGREPAYSRKRKPHRERGEPAYENLNNFAVL